MNSRPLFQIALDVADIDEALRIAEDVREFADVIEVGTVLLKKEGVRSIERIKTDYPDKLVFADTKTVDFGQLEAQIVFQAGADIMSVCGVATDETILEALEEACAHRKKVLVDLIGLGDSYRQAKRLSFLGPDYLSVHSGTDRHTSSDELFEKVEVISQISPIPLMVSGGILLDDVTYLMMFHPAIIVVGSSIIHSPRRRETAERFWRSINTLPFLPSDYEDDMSKE
ncbi:3-hexulose-6-phosphate synthase [candidate division KSB3 bacterium]|uniref:3-hexulose-6-phosphate synthase n=1 Tax=candidate division KSB3 bacterium TaxID=2044937 RepID=A0A2G6E2V3_9BACT|nr:MAG: 3-hexulose-6-phosphate synthase [candidate division KSB3 bacterium]PIE28672.1 MAG: 3-hexulose-6-phosphate synthase [candidate division KSB3 bacterium]